MPEAEQLSVNERMIGLRRFLYAGSGEKKKKQTNKKAFGPLHVDDIFPMILSNV
jgi:hypothetical protein